MAAFPRMVREAGRQAEVVIVSCHIGAEGEGRSAITRANELFLGENRGNPYAFAHAAIDAGADIVFCHGPHIPRAIEVYRGRFIAYSLGNFWTYGRFSLRGSSTLAPIAVLDVARDGRLLSARIVSARQDRPGGPYYDPAGGAARRIAALTAQDFPDSGISIAEDGTVRWRGGREVEPTPASGKAGTHEPIGFQQSDAVVAARPSRSSWVPAFAGMTFNGDVAVALRLPQRPAIFLERERIERCSCSSTRAARLSASSRGRILHLGLGEDRARIEVGGDEVDRAAGIFVAGERARGGACRGPCAAAAGSGGC